MQLTKECENITYGNRKALYKDETQKVIINSMINYCRLALSVMDSPRMTPSFIFKFNFTD